MHPGKLLTCTTGLLVGCLLVLGLAGGQDVPGWAKGKQDKGPKDKGDPEAKAVVRAAERATKVPDPERDKWLERLNKAYPGRVSPGLTDADFDQWFGLLAGGGPEWRREAAPTKNVAELFDRVAGRLELGRVEIITRAEFLGYARRFLSPSNPAPWKVPDPLEDVDKVFRSLDQDRSGSLEPAEWTDRLRAAAPRVDANRDGRVDPAEYRGYFEGRVVTTLQYGPEPPTPGPDPRAGVAPHAGPGQPAPGPVAIRPGHLPPGLPPWFEQLDADRDGQVGLYEWRAAGRAIKEFITMDLDGDGLLPPDEYLRHVRLAAITAAAADPGAEPAAPPPSPPPGGKKGKKGMPPG